MEKEYNQIGKVAVELIKNSNFPPPVILVWNEM